ncbi:MAG: hypothetical protein DRJ38_06820 [Thermoprotei archaeon]|nr:MAG: hypothetical protein DRJ38_06820 [Thermoprotei archaeon]
MLQEIFYKALEVGYRHGWDRKIAKYARAPGRGRHQSLLHHALNTALVGWKLAEILKVEERYLRPLFVGLFLHDFTKSGPIFQGLAAGTGKGKVGKIPQGDERAIFESLLDEFGLDEWERKTAVNVAFLNETPQKPEDFIEQLGMEGLPGRLLDIAVVADILNSLQGYWDLDNVKEILDKYGYKVAYHRVSVIRGMVTQLVHRTVENLMKKYGFEPVVYLADGAVYIGEGDKIPDKEKVREELFEILRNALKKVGGKKLGESAFGAIQQVIVKIPEYLYVSDEAIKFFWKYIRGINPVQKPNYQKIYSYLKEASPGLSDVELENLSLKAKTVHNLWLIFNGVRQVFESKGVTQEVWLNVLKELVGPVDFQRVAELANTTPTEKVVNATLAFLRETKLIEEKREAIIDTLIKAFAIASIKMRRYAEDKGLIKEVFRDAVDIMLDEVVISLYNGGIGTTVKIKLGEYVEGKARGTPVCVICGREAKYEAAASLVGKGTQSFLNLLPGGVRISKTMKARICPVCRLEGSLRSLLNFKPDRWDVYYVAPMFTMSPQYSSMFWNELNKALIAGRELSVTNPDFKEKFVKGKVDVLSIAKNPLELHTILGKSKEEVIGELAKWLEKNVEDLEYFCEIVGEKVANWLEAAKLVVEKGLKDYGLGEDYSIAFFSGNFMMLFTMSPGPRDEPETSKMLRRLNLALMLHYMFHAAVYIPDEKMVPFAEFRPLGAARAPLKVDLVTLLRSRGFRLEDGWVSIPQALALSEILTAAELVEDSMRRTRTGYGRAGLLEVLTRPPGMVLKRFVDGGFSYKKVGAFLEFLDFLDRWWYEQASS